MKYFNIILSISYLVIAFSLAYQIDIKDNHHLMASSVAFFAMLGGMRFSEYCEELSKENKKNG